MKRLRMYVIPLSVMAVLVFAAHAVAQSVPEGLDANQNTTGVQNSTSDPAKPAKAPAQSTAPSQSTAPALVRTMAVNIHDRTFDPAQLSVAPGTTVIWTNRDTEAHTVTADNGLFDSGVLEPGQSYTTWLGGSGTVAYHCKIHPDMKGTVVVDGAIEGASGGGETSMGNPATSSSPAQIGTTAGDPASNPSKAQKPIAEDIHQLPIYSPPA